MRSLMSASVEELDTLFGEATAMAAAKVLKEHMGSWLADKYDPWTDADFLRTATAILKAAKNASKSGD